MITVYTHTQDKPALILTGRVHPGESNASFMMHGMLEFLLSPSQYASELRRNFLLNVVSFHTHLVSFDTHLVSFELRRNFLLYVVPMLNPDGVILGNHHCNRTVSLLHTLYYSVLTLRANPR